MATIESIEKTSANGMFEYYDVWQMFKHTLAIRNYLCESGERKHKKVTLLNVVFEPGNSFMSDNAKKEYARQVDKEHEGFRCFRNALIENGIIGEGKSFNVKYMSVMDFIKNFEMPDSKLRYLRRYVL